jgi:tRNA A-37 threonylcarbamoyl transferase component Bud32/tetratricopeptide (TPR) repeat protein
MLPLTPTKLGRYEIVDEIGKGAMGVVYLARDPLIGRLVALKTFRIGYSVKDQEMEQFRIRFMREAQSAGILTHPNIVTIHDVVEGSEEGLAFIAMEYVRGTNLKLLLQGEQPLSLHFVVDTIAQVGDALDYAHSNRVVHRDVKPANILIAAENRVKITDFGIARLDSSNLTQEGQLLGTPNYMAPEQIQGKEVDHRADLFSLGVVLYEMLTRHKPFQGDNLTVVSHRIVYDHFTPPREYVQQLPPGLDKILVRALEKDPARRYQRAREMVDDLRRLMETVVPKDSLNETQSLSATMVLPRPAAPEPSLAPDLADTAEIPAGAVPGRPERPGISPRWLLAGGGAAALALILLYAGVLLWKGWSRPAPAPPPAVTAQQGAEVQRAQASTLLERANAAMRKGDFPTAISLYRMAEQVDPSLRPMREAAERQDQGFKDLIAKEQSIAANVAEAKKMLAARKYDQAAALATIAVALDPKNEEANGVLAQAQAQLRRARPRTGPAAPQPGPGQEVAGTIPIPSDAQPNNAPTPVEAANATVHVHFKSELANGGVVIVYVNRRERIRENIPASKGGFFRRSRKEEPREYTWNLEVPAGPNVEIRISVAPTGRKAMPKTFNNGFAGGSSHELEIHAFESQVTAHLN